MRERRARRREERSGSAAASRLALVAVLVAAGLALAVTADHAGEERYYIPAYGVAIAVGAFALAAAGGVVIWRSARVELGIAAGVAATLAVLGVLAIFTVGILLLIAAAAVAVLVAARAGSEPDSGVAVVGGGMLGAGVAALGAIALSPPLVDCESGRAGENLFLGLRSSSGSGTGGGGADGRSSGRVSGDGYEFEYVCRDGTLVHFDFRAH